MLIKRLIPVFVLLAAGVATSSDSGRVREVRGAAGICQTFAVETCASTKQGEHCEAFPTSGGENSDNTGYENGPITTCSSWNTPNPNPQNIQTECYSALTAAVLKKSPLSAACVPKARPPL
jgi:hypothetical protein